MPRLGEKEMKSAIIYEAENYIPMPLDKVYVDFEEMRMAKEPNRVDVLLAALPREIIDARVRVAIRAGLKPVVMELESQAVSRSVMPPQYGGEPVIIMQIGDAKSNIIIYAASSVRFTFSVPISSAYFIQTISRSLGVDADVARNLIVDHGIEKFGASLMNPETVKNVAPDDAKERKIFEALIPGLVDFVQQVGKYVDYYHTHSSQGRIGGGKDRISRAILCGSGANLKGFDEFISLKLGVPVAIANPWAGIKFKSARKLSENSCGYPGSFATAVGLALRALGEDDPVEVKPENIKISTAGFRGENVPPKAPNKMPG